MHRFARDGEISELDLGQLIKLTEVGRLHWRHAERDLCAFNAYPVVNDQLDLTGAGFAQLGENLANLRFGYNPADSNWHYLRLIDPLDLRYYVEAPTHPEIHQLTDRLYSLVRKAHRLCGTLWSPEDARYDCQACGRSTQHRALVDRPYGLEGAVMGGSERLVCLICEHVQPLPADWKRGQLAG